MPSAMIHLLIAHEVDPNGPDLFWFGNFAPDYTDYRPLKDHIHFRNAANRLEALRQFKDTIDMENPFEAGWLLHLFADACWDTLEVSAFQQKYGEALGSPQWFLKYREEINLASFYLYHHIYWAPHVWDQILRADLTAIPSRLPLTQEESDSFRTRVHKRHFESDKGSISLEYDDQKIFDFVRNTAQKYLQWCEHDLPISLVNSLDLK